MANAAVELVSRGSASARHYLPPASGPVRWDRPQSVPSILCGHGGEFTRTPERVTCRGCRAHPSFPIRAVRTERERGEAPNRRAAGVDDVDAVILVRDGPAWEVQIKREEALPLGAYVRAFAALVLGGVL